MPEIVLLGNGLALLVAACVLGRQGKPVTWVTDGRKPGGFFAGVRIGEDCFDFGSVLLERPGRADSRPDLDSYDPGARYDAARFTGAAWSLIDSAVSVRRAPTALCVRGEARCPDYLLSNRLDGLAGLNLEPPREAADLGPGHPWHASHKLAPGAYDTLDYAQAGHHNHGQAVHEALFAPFWRKLTRGRPWPLMARFHRTGWLPLYHPRTIVQALAGQPTGLPEYPVWLPQAGWCGALVQALLDEVAGHRSVRRVDEAIVRLERHDGHHRVTCRGGAELAASALAVGLPSERAHALLGLPAPTPAHAASVRLLLLRVRQEAIGRPAGCLMLPDPSGRAYRISDLDLQAGREAAWHRVTVEAVLDGAPSEEAALDAQLLVEVRQVLGVADAATGIEVAGAFSLPSAVHMPTVADVQAAMGDLSRLHEVARGVHLSGGLAGYGATSLQDHIVQGLVMARRLQ